MSLSLDDIIARLDSLPPDERKEVARLADKATAHMKWIPNPGPQTLAYDCEADQMLYGGEAGGGKGVAYGTNVLTPFGWRKAESLKVGDKVCATDGTVTELIGVFHRGVQKTYRMTWSDGSTSTVDVDHIWRGWWAGETRKINNKATAGEAGAANWTMAELIQASEKPGHRRFAIPVMSAPCTFNVAGSLYGHGNFVKRELHPYILGVLLGDGSMTDSCSGVTWCKPDVEIADRIDEILAGYGLDARLSRYASEDSAPVFRIPNAYRVKEYLNQVKLWGCGSADKFIPKIYLLASADERWELLRGLMDTDGWAEEDGDCYFGSTSQQLAHDVRHLARSLGAICTIRERDPTYTYKGEARTGQHFYTLRIKMPDPARMFTLDRKRERCSTDPHHMALFLNVIEDAGEQKTVCFKVRHPNSLYVIDDFVVTHNTDLLLGLASQEHLRSLLLRRINKDVSWLVDRLAEIIDTRNGYNGQDDRWTFPDGRVIDFSGCQHPGDEQRNKGRPKDFIGFDEASDFLEQQVEFILGWLRSTVKGQRCRAVFATNPPTSVEGEWIVRWFAPWVDPQHPLYPYPMGKLLYTCRGSEDEWLWFEEPGPQTVNGEERLTISRTFIRSGLGDNPDLARTNYKTQLQMLPEELRKRYERGDFTAGASDDEFQVIPTEWIRAAQDRWIDADGVTMEAVGIDVAQGGNDNTVMAPRWKGKTVTHWIDKLRKWKGKETPDGATVAGLFIQLQRNAAQANIDMGGGYGGATFEKLKEAEMSVYGFVPSEGSEARTADGRLGFRNKRAEATWRVRELLAPESKDTIALPPDAQLRADLASYRWKLVSGGIIQVESKDDIKKRIGRSPDDGDALIIAMSTGSKRQQPRRGESFSLSAPSYARTSRPIFKRNSR